MTVRQRLVNTPLDIGNLAVAKGRCHISREPCLPSRRQNIGRKSRAPNACQAPVSALAGSGPFAAIQTIFATIFVISSAEKARNDSVRMLPSALRLKLSAVAATSSGASVIITMS